MVFACMSVRYTTSCERISMATLDGKQVMLVETAVAIIEEAVQRVMRSDGVW